VCPWWSCVLRVVPHVYSHGVVVTRAYTHTRAVVVVVSRILYIPYTLSLTHSEPEHQPEPERHQSQSQSPSSLERTRTSPLVRARPELAPRTNHPNDQAYTPHPPPKARPVPHVSKVVIPYTLTDPTSAPPPTPRAQLQLRLSNLGLKVLCSY